MFHNLRNRIYATWHPEAYHGWGRTHRYFEGWYFKLISPDTRTALAVIPGISMDASGKKQAFIQVMDGVNCRATYHPFDAGDFRPESGRFGVSIGDNYFCQEYISLQLPDLQGRISFENPTPWPRMLGAPGIMGWYSFVPFMECFHGVLSMHHGLKGALLIENSKENFDGGKGYIEKDWGRSFPRAYVWMQTNHFDTSDRASLMASVAHIPWLNSYFIGFISGFWLEGRLFRFATYTGAKQYLQLKDDTVELIFKSPTLELRLLARQAAGTSLHSPISGAMTGKINESLQATVQTELLENGRRIFEGTGSPAGLEVAGETEWLVK